MDRFNLPKVGIIVLNWNGKEDTKKCLLSLQKLTYPNREIVLVDNGSTDGSQEFFCTHFPHITLLETGENLGYAGGNNVGISYGLKNHFDFFFLLNNDTIVNENILEAFLKQFSSNPKTGILGGKIYLMNEPHRLDHFGGMWNRKRLEFDYVGYRELDLEKEHEAAHLDYVCGAAIIFRKSVVEKIGLMESRFFLYWEEADYCFLAKKNGFEVMSCPRAILWHKVSASFSSKPHAAYFVWRNRFFWIERNFHGSKRFFYLSRLLLSELPLLYSKKIIRTLQVLYQKLVKSETKRNQERIRRYDAAICGIHDYLLRRFGPGRSKNFMNCH